MKFRLSVFGIVFIFPLVAALMVVFIHNRMLIETKKHIFSTNISLTMSSNEENVAETWVGVGYFPIKGELDKRFEKFSEIIDLRAALSDVLFEMSPTNTCSGSFWVDGFKLENGYGILNPRFVDDQAIGVQFLRNGHCILKVRKILTENGKVNKNIDFSDQEDNGRK